MEVTRETGLEIHGLACVKNSAAVNFLNDGKERKVMMKEGVGRQNR